MRPHLGLIGHIVFQLDVSYERALFLHEVLDFLVLQVRAVPIREVDEFIFCKGFEVDVYEKVLCVGMASHFALVLLEDLLVDEEAEALAGLLEAAVVFDEVELVEEDVRVLVQGHLDAELDHVLRAVVVQDHLDGSHGLLRVLLQNARQDVGEDLRNPLLVTNDLRRKVHARDYFDGELIVQGEIHLCSYSHFEQIEVIFICVRDRSKIMGLFQIQILHRLDLLVEDKGTFQFGHIVVQFGQILINSHIFAVVHLLLILFHEIDQLVKSILQIERGISFL